MTPKEFECANCSKDSQNMCSRCRSVAYCSKECQSVDWKLHKRVCVPPPPTEPVKGIIIPCQADKGQPGPGIFHSKDIEPTHEIYTQGVVCPLSKRDAGLDNQIATYLMIEPADGFAPPRWQQCVGTVTVMRQDRKPLTHEAFETIRMYHDHLQYLFGKDKPPRRQMTKTGFQKYCRKYKEERLTNGYNKFEDMPVPL